MSIKLATHLYRNRHGTFYFRLVLPRDLRSHLQQNEIRFSLHTEQRRVAIPSAALLVVGLPELIAALRRMAENNEAIPPDYFTLWREQLIENVGLKAEILALQSDLTEQQERMAQMYPRAKTVLLGKIMRDRGRLTGIEELGNKLMFPWPPEKTALFSELKVAYLNAIANFRPDSGVKKPPSKNTLREYERSLDLFISIMGDCRIGEIKKNKAVGEYFMLLK